MNKKQKNKWEQQREFEEAFQYVKDLSDESKEWLLFVMLGGTKQNFGFAQVKGKLLKFLSLLNMFMEYQSLRVNMPDPSKKIEFEIWQDALEEAPSVFREDIFEWIQENFPRALSFDLHHVLSKNSKALQDEDSFNCLVAHARKTAKKLNTRKAKSFYNLKSVKDIADQFMVV